MTITRIALLAAAALVAAPALAADGPYAAVAAGYLHLPRQSFEAFGQEGRLDFDEGGQATAALGYRFGPVRLELEAGYGRIGRDSVALADRSAAAPGSLALLTGTLVAYADWSLGPASLFAGGGVGLARHEAGFLEEFAGADGAPRRRTDLLLQAEAGLAWPLMPGLELVPSYRYGWVDAGRDGVTGDLDWHGLRLGLRFGL